MHTGVMSTSADSKNPSLKNSGVNPDKTAESIKNIAKSIREASAKMRETVRTLRESGAIDELTQAVYEATVAARDTAKELNDAARDLKERGIIKTEADAEVIVNMISSFSLNEYYRNQLDVEGYLKKLDEALNIIKEGVAVVKDVGKKTWSI